MKKDDEIQSIYLDACATTPIRTEVSNKIFEVQKYYWGNPSSIHSEGIKSAEILEKSRISIASCFGSKPSELIFTSSATESIHLALLGSARLMQPARIVLSTVEHPSVVYAASCLVEEGWTLSFVPVNSLGVIEENHLDSLLSPPTKIVSITSAQNEIGTIQPIKRIGEICRKRNIIFHTDATQYISQFSMNWKDMPVDLLSASGHKIQGPKGIGMLFHRNLKIKPILGGGLQEDCLRAGTESVSLVAGLALACEILNQKSETSGLYNSKEAIRVRNLTNRLRFLLEDMDCLKFTGDPINRLPNHISLLVGSHKNDPLNGSELVRQLSNLGVCASSGSACKKGKGSGNQILRAIGIEENWLGSGLRFSLGSWVNDGDIDSIPQLLEEAIVKTSML